MSSEHKIIALRKNRDEWQALAKEAKVIMARMVDEMDTLEKENKRLSSSYSQCLDQLHTAEEYSDKINQENKELKEVIRLKGSDLKFYKDEYKTLKDRLELMDKAMAVIEKNGLKPQPAGNA